MRTLLIASVFALASAGVGTADTQNYPSRPISMVVPLPAGSAFDITARIVAERMQASLGQPVIVENVTGASGSIGAGRVAARHRTATRSASAASARTFSMVRFCRFLTMFSGTSRRSRWLRARSS